MGELVGELAPLFAGRRLETIVPRVPSDVVLAFASLPDEDPRSGSLRLRLSAAPDAPRFHLQVAREKRPKGPLGPFFRDVEQALAGARLKRIVQLARDRAVALEFDRTADGEPRSLVLELFGRRANLVLCGRGERVQSVLVPPGAGGKSPPRLQPGEPWSAPGGPPREPPSGERLARDLAALAPDGEPPGAAAGLEPDPRAPLSWAVETVLADEAHGAERERAARDVRSRLERKLGRARGLVAGLEKRATASDDAERVRLDGELLKASQSSWKRGAESVELPDVYTEDAPLRRIALDPRRSPRENVERTFDRYKKLVRAQASVAQELELARARVGALETLLERLDDPASEPLGIEREAIEAGVLDARQVADVRKRKAPEPRKPYRSFSASRGSEIRVGRSARDNDELTLRHSRGNDLWLHTADAPGSHVVLRLERGADPDDDELLDAAHLAAHFSPLREASRVNVHVARRKQVHKPRGAKAGLVSLSGGRVLAVRMQPERIRRLLGRSDRGPA